MYALVSSFASSFSLGAEGEFDDVLHHSITVGFSSMSSNRDPKLSLDSFYSYLLSPLWHITVKARDTQDPGELRFDTLFESIAINVRLHANQLNGGKCSRGRRAHVRRP
jgi:hypothetical protein